MKDSVKEKLSEEQQKGLQARHDLIRAKRIIGRLWPDRAVTRALLRATERVVGGLAGERDQLRADLAEAQAEVGRLRNALESVEKIAELEACEIEYVGPSSAVCHMHCIKWNGRLDFFDEAPACPVYVAKVEGVRLGLEAGAKQCIDDCLYDRYAIAANIRALDPEAIAKGADRG